MARSAILVLCVVSCALEGIGADLALYLPLDEGKGIVTRDPSGSPLCGILQGSVEWTDGRFGKALRFKGDSTGRVRLDLPADWFNKNMNGLSALMWAKPNTPGRIFFGAHAPASSRLYLAVSQAGNWDMGIQDKNWGTQFTGAPLKAAPGWHAIALTMNQGTATLYVDGKKTIEKAYTPFEIAEAPILGGVAPGGAEEFCFDGGLDEVAFFKGVLTETEIADATKGIRRTAAFAAACAKGPGAATDESLVASWRLDEAAGEVVADSTRNGLGGRVLNPGWREGLVGIGLRFRGESAIEVPKHPQLNNLSALTVEWWMNWDPRGGQFPTFVALGDRFVAYAYRYSQRLFLLVTTSEGTAELPTGAVLPVYEWCHVVVTWDGAFRQAAIYVNGKMAWQGVAPGGVLRPTDAPLTIGRTGKSTKHDLCNLSGDVDEVRVYNKALGADAVADRFARLAELARTRSVQRWMPAPAANEKLEARTAFTPDGKHLLYPDFPMDGEPGERAKTLSAADFPSIQAAVDSLPKMGGMVVVPAGVWEIDSPIVLRSAVTLAGAGEGTIIVNRNQEGKNAIEVRENVQYRPPDRFPPGATGNHGVVVKDLQVRGNPKSGYGVYLFQADHAQLENVSSFFHGKSGIAISYGEENCTVRGVISKWNREHGFYIEGCHDTFITASHFEENLLDGCHVQKDNIQAVFVACNMEDNGRFGVYNKGRWTQVVGCEADGNEGGAFVYIGPEAEYSTTVSSNIGGPVKAVNAHNVAITGNDGAVFLSGCHDCTVTGNTGAVITLSDGCHRIAVTGNSVGRITVEPTCHDNVVSGNVARTGLKDEGRNNAARDNIVPAKGR